MDFLIEKNDKKVDIYAIENHDVAVSVLENIPIKDLKKLQKTIDKFLKQ